MIKYEFTFFQVPERDLSILLLNAYYFPWRHFSEKTLNYARETQKKQKKGVRGYFLQILSSFLS